MHAVGVERAPSDQVRMLAKMGMEQEFAVLCAHRRRLTLIRT